MNGYCDLLALTSLTEEQALYVKSIQQACHAINVIAGNVLGTFSCVFPFVLSLIDLIHSLTSLDFSKVSITRFAMNPPH